MKKVIETVDALFASKTFKFLFLSFLVGTAALFLGKLASDQWIELIKWLGGMATVRGTGEHVTEAIAKKKHETEKIVAGLSDSQLADRIVDRTRS